MRKEGKKEKLCFNSFKKHDAGETLCYFMYSFRLYSSPVTYRRMPSHVPPGLQWTAAHVSRVVTDRVTDIQTDLFLRQLSTYRAHAVKNHYHLTFTENSRNPALI